MTAPAEPNKTAVRIAAAASFVLGGFCLLGLIVAAVHWLF